MSSEATDQPGKHLTAERVEILRAELERLLASEAFCNSRQSERLMRYLVQHTLEHDGNALRERVIGVEVFGREPGYDSTSDSIVRVRVNEIRKRLAKYYDGREGTPPVRIAIPAGSYQVEFEFASEPPPPAPRPGPPPAETRRRVPWLVVAAGFVGVLAVALVLLKARPATTLDRFWSPALESPGQVVVCFPGTVVYRFRSSFEEKVRGAAPTHMQWLTVPLPLRPDLAIRAART